MSESSLYLGIELGSTRIKAALIDSAEGYKVVASGWHDWENKLENGFWTYPLEEALNGVKNACAKLAADYKGDLSDIKGIGISAMMHGYLAFDKDGKLLTPFRTWRNTTTAEAAEKLTEAFSFNIPQRWSIAHLYQAILNNEPHVKDIAFMTTLAGYIHWKLTGEKVLGVGDASGMFPIDENGAYDNAMLCKFEEMTGTRLTNILPRILSAGENAGSLTEEGAKLLGVASVGAAVCPPEGDAGTGMVATNSVKPRTGNVSAGTSIFAMIVLEEALKKVYPEIDIVTTPSGAPVAMVHCNSCTSDLDAWVGLLGEAARLMGAVFSKPELYDKLYFKALEGAKDGGGLVSYNYYSGEPVVGMDDGCPLLFRKNDSNLNIADFMRVQIYSAMATLKLGMDILAEENVKIDSLLGHGGLFKTKGVGQKLMAAALNTPVSVMASAAEGGAWGIALLAAYVQNSEIPLDKFLTEKVFAGDTGITEKPQQDDVTGFIKFMELYKKGLGAERLAAEIIKEI